MSEHGRPTPPPLTGVTESLARDLEDFVKANFGSVVTGVSAEIQDGFRFVLVSLTVDSETAIGDALRAHEIIAAETGRRVPGRPDEYSWMVNIKSAGDIFRTAMGGWIGHDDV
jgi:hypothetical protein